MDTLTQGALEAGTLRAFDDFMEQTDFMNMEDLLVGTPTTTVVGFPGAKGL